MQCYLARGTDPNGPASYGHTVTTSAAMRSPLSVIKLLVGRDGIIAGTDSVALAVFGYIACWIDSKLWIYPRQRRICRYSSLREVLIAEGFNVINLWNRDAATNRS